MLTFTTTGNKKYDYYLINGNKDWANIPAGKIKGINQDLPIRLNIGDRSWGYEHINTKHKHWFKKIKSDVLNTLYLKLGQSGTIFNSEDSEKSKISLTITPSALLVFRISTDKEKNDYLSIVTMYSKQGAIDGEKIGRYTSEFRTVI